MANRTKLEDLAERLATAAITPLTEDDALLFLSEAYDLGLERAAEVCDTQAKTLGINSPWAREHGGAASGLARRIRALKSGGE